MSDFAEYEGGHTYFPEATQYDDSFRNKQDMLKGKQIVERDFPIGSMNGWEP